MPSFKDFMETERMEAPAERRAEDLQRSEEKYDPNAKLHYTSVSVQHYSTAMKIAGVVVAIMIAALAVFLIYRGVELFIPSDKR